MSNIAITFNRAPFYDCSRFKAFACRVGDGTYVVTRDSAGWTCKAVDGHHQGRIAGRGITRTLAVQDALRQRESLRKGIAQ